MKSSLAILKTWLTADLVVGPPILITIEIVAKAIIKMKNGRAPGSSEIFAEMLKASSDTDVQLVADLAIDMIRNSTIPSDWENSFIININKGKGDALIRGNYRGLKLLDHVMKGIERVMEKIIRERVLITCNLASCLDGAQLMQYLSSDSCKKNIWLRTGNCTLLLLTLKRHLIEYQEKLFGGPCENLAFWNELCSLHRLCTTMPEVKLESVNNTYSDEFGVKVGFHQGSVLSPLLFIIVLKALSRELCTGTPWDLFHADDLVIIPETEDELRMKLIK